MKADDITVSYSLRLQIVIGTSQTNKFNHKIEDKGVAVGQFIL